MITQYEYFMPEYRLRKALYYYAIESTSEDS